MTIKGSCLCKGVEYEADGPLEIMIHCHCSRCRKAHGAAYVTYASSPPAGFRWLKGEDLIETWEGRSFCRTCGGNLPNRTEERVDLPVGSLDDDPGLRPAFHIFAGSKAAFHQITDDLVQHDEYPPEWTGEGEDA